VRQQLIQALVQQGAPGESRGTYRFAARPPCEHKIINAGDYGLCPASMPSARGNHRSVNLIQPP
jgi:hypothetical protein